MVEIPESHPQYDVLQTRHRIEEGVEQGITHLQGLLAEGRGEAFDYLIGNRTTDSADNAARAAAAQLLLAENPVLSINGNVAALVPGDIIELGNIVGAELEINLFNRSEDRIQAIASHLRDHGATDLKGLDPDARIPGLEHDRARVDRDGIYSADVVLIPLEDGDRAEALEEMGKIELVIDLNPLSRSAQTATIPIIDNVIRAIPNIIRHATDLKSASHSELTRILNDFDREAALEAAETAIRTGALDTDGSAES